MSFRIGFGDFLEILIIAGGVPCRYLLCQTISMRFSHVSALALTTTLVAAGCPAGWLELPSGKCVRVLVGSTRHQHLCEARCAAAAPNASAEVPPPTTMCIDSAGDEAYLRTHLKFPARDSMGIAWTSLRSGGEGRSGEWMCSNERPLAYTRWHVNEVDEPVMANVLVQPPADMMAAYRAAVRATNTTGDERQAAIALHMARWGHRVCSTTGL